MENNKRNSMSKEFQEEAKKLGLTGYQLIQKYKEEEGEITGDTISSRYECPNCNSTNLEELLSTPNGSRIKCLDCNEIFVDKSSIDVCNDDNDYDEDDNKKINKKDGDDLIRRRLEKINKKLSKSKNVRKKFVNSEVKRSEEILEGNKKYFVFLYNWEKGERNGKYISIEKYEARNSKIYEEGKVWVAKQQLTVTNVVVLDKIIEELLKMKSDLENSEI